MCRYGGVAFEFGLVFVHFFVTVVPRRKISFEASVRKTRRATCAPVPQNFDASALIVLFYFLTMIENGFVINWDRLLAARSSCKSQPQGDNSDDGDDNGQTSEREKRRPLMSRCCWFCHHRRSWSSCLPKQRVAAFDPSSKLANEMHREASPACLCSRLCLLSRSLLLR